MKDSIIEELMSIPIYEYVCIENIPIHNMVNKTFNQVINKGNNTIIFINDNEAFIFHHIQGCCELVEIESICGNLSDLEKVPILKADEVTNLDLPAQNSYDESYTWTFYKFATIKGYVDIRWYGTSNGYYSESVDLTYFPIKDGKLIPLN